MEQVKIIEKDFDDIQLGIHLCVSALENKLSSLEGTVPSKELERILFDFGKRVHQYLYQDDDVSIKLKSKAVEDALVLVLKEKRYCYNVLGDATIAQEKFLLDGFWNAFEDDALIQTFVKHASKEKRDRVAKAFLIDSFDEEKLVEHIQSVCAHHAEHFASFDPKPTASKKFWHLADQIFSQLLKNSNEALALARRHVLEDDFGQVFDVAQKSVDRVLRIMDEPSLSVLEFPPHLFPTVPFSVVEVRWEF